jgi:Tol biopolymer transport system component
MVSELWVRDPSGGEHRLASEVGDRSGAEGFAWTPDDEIVYPVRSTEHLNLWRVPASGGLPRQVTIGPGNNFHPIVSPDGRYLVFASDRAGSIRLWRMPLSGGNAVALTSGHEEVRPSMAGEGRWIVYQQGHGWGRHTVWKVPTAGGEAVEVVHSSAIRPAVSPDEKMIAYFAMDGRGWYIAVMSLFGGPPLHTFPIPAIGSRVLRWMPDGRGLAYVDDRDDVSNIWLQRIDGGPPLQLARFTGGDIVAFDWSPDGRQLAYLRVTRSSDVVRLRNAVRPKALQ